MQVFSTKNFDKGLYTTIEDYSIPEEAASASLNWLTLGDKIELSGGYTIVGTEQVGTGKVTGLVIAEKVDGTKFPVYTHTKKIKYYSGTDWVEVGTDKLGAAASGEDVAISAYTSSAGYQIWLSSKNSSLFKMMIANPADIKDMYDSAKNYKGYLTAQNGRLLMWQRLYSRNYIYGSYKDLQNSTVYTDVVAEAIGAAPGPTYTGTLAAVSGKRTCFNVAFTDGTVTLSDDKNGTFYTSSATGSGTGTINYATGAYSVTFGAPTVGAVTANYSWEDSTLKGLADFTFSATRTAAQGFYLPQSTGGDIQNILPYQTNSYCLHSTNCWLLNISVDDLTVTNQEFRSNIGMKNWRAAVATGDGIYYIDTSNPIKPTFNLMTLDSSNSQVIPQVISYNIDLSGYDFSGGVGFFWNNYILFSGKVNGATNNNRLFAYNKIWKSFDVLDYYTTCFGDYSGELWGGDSASNNIQKLFSTTSANGALINNYWEGKLSRLGIEEIKKYKRLTFRGDIGAAQNLKISVSYDHGAFVELGRILGTGSYVDKTAAHTVGSDTIGSAEVGGGGTGVEASPYIREFRVRSSKFDQIKIRIEATAAGYASISQSDFYDIQTFGQKNVLRYRQTS